MVVLKQSINTLDKIHPENIKCTFTDHTLNNVQNTLSSYNVHENDTKKKTRELKKEQ